jgi:hypothetical protein
MARFVLHAILVGFLTCASAFHFMVDDFTVSLVILRDYLGQLH